MSGAKDFSIPQLSPGHSGITTIGHALERASAANALQAPITSLYIHIPFCYHKCHYCDFYSIVDEHDRQETFTHRLVQELRALAPYAGPLRTIFIGGGTPSLLRVNLWQRLLSELATLFDLRPIVAGLPETEFTVECNPETVTPELARTLRAGGVNRISMGAQSFEPRHLATLERWHNPESVERAIEIFRAAGMPRLSVDLIFAIPGQTLDEWHSDLRRALALRTTHLSCYNLTYEPNTAMTARLQRGEFEPMGEDLEAEMYTCTRETLAAAGLERYEVSNYALQGQESQHNLVYWRNQQWLAAGPGAAGHARGWRWKNAPNLVRYLEGGGTPALAGFAPAVDLEPPDPARTLREQIMMGIRIREGLDAPALLAEAEAIEPGSAAILDRAATQMMNSGLLLRSADRWQLTDAGFLCADHVAAGLMQVVGER